MAVVQANQVLEYQSQIESYGGDTILLVFMMAMAVLILLVTSMIICIDIFAAEFTEHDEKPLPIDIRLVGALAEKCRAFAKVLHYKEMEFEGARSKKMDTSRSLLLKFLYI